MTPMRKGCNTVRKKYIITTELVSDGRVWHAKGVRATHPMYEFNAFASTREGAIDRLIQAVELARCDYDVALSLNAPPNTKTRTEARTI